MSKSARAMLARLAVAMGGAALAVAASADPFDLGRPLAAPERDRLAITVFPDGSGLPSGSGSGSVAAGRVLYATHCAACHGARGEGSNDFHALAGGVGSLRSKHPVPTVGSYWPFATTLWDYIRRGMPYAAPGSLSADETYSLTAYVLFLNKLVEDLAVMDARSLARVRMPNRDGFVADPRPDFKPAGR